MEPIHCTAFLARLRLSPRGSAPIDVEIAEPPGTAFRRAGRLRVSPIVDVPDFGLLPEPQRRGFGALVAWLEAHESEVAFGARRSPRPARNAYPFLLASLLLAGIALVRGSYVARTELYWGGGVFAAALLLRVLLGVWGPFHVNGQGPLWVGFAVSGHVPPSYGPGFAELFQLATRMWPSAPDRAIFTLNVALSAVAPALLYALARSTGLERARALLATGLLALDPVSIRIAATESYFPALIALWLGAGVSLAIGTQAAESSRLRHAALWFVTAACLAAAALRTHPVVWPAVALLPLACLVVPAPVHYPWCRRTLLAGLAAVVIAAVFAASAIRWLPAYVHELLNRTDVQDVSRVSGSPTALGHLASGWLPFALLVPTVFLAFVIVRAMRPRRLLVLGVPALGALLLARSVYNQSVDWQWAFDRLYLAPILLAMVAMLPERATRHSAYQLAVAVGAVVLVALSVRYSRHRTTDQIEYRWVRGALQQKPAQCTVLYVGRADRRVISLPLYVGGNPRLALNSGLEVRTDAEIEQVRELSEPCLWYIRTSLCSSREGRDRCARVEQALQLRRLDGRVFPAVPSYDSLPYDRPALEAGIFAATRRLVRE